MTAAVSKIARIKDGVSSKLQLAKQNLNTSKTELERLRAEFNVGNLSETAFQGSEQKLLKSIDNSRAEIARLQSLMEAKTSGQVDLEEGIKRRGILPRWSVALAIIVPLLVIGLFTSWWVWERPGPETPPATPPPAQTQTPQPQPPKPQPASPDWPGIATKTKPSVVRILTTESYSGNRYGVGSGIIINQEGYVLTCNHVVENVLSIKVALYEGKQYDAKVISTDPNADLAILKISSDYVSLQGLTVATLGDSDVLQDGEDIMAIGYPPLLEKTIDTWLSSDPKVTRGIVSGKPLYKGVKLIQTDASVSGGNSGGPLINGRGEIIGVVSFVVVEEKVQNANFAIAINEAKPFIKQVTGK